MSKVIKPIVIFDHRGYVFETITAAAKAIEFFGKLKPVAFTENCDEPGYHYAPAERPPSIELVTDREFRAKPKRLSLPAPKRGTVQCSNCESVSVRPGRACESCGTIAALPTT